MSESISKILLLTGYQYCYIIDNNTGVVCLIEGPYRGHLKSNEMIFGIIQNKIIVKKGQYAIVLNPYSNELHDVRNGEREIRIGPLIFSLYPGEDLESGKVKDEFLLTQDSGLLIKAICEYEENGIKHKAGDLWIVQGPTHFIPNKYINVEKEVQALSLGLNEGFYVKNIRTGEIRLEKGPKTFMISPEEALYEKIYSEKELDALNLKGKEFDRTRPIPLRLLTNEVMLILAENNHRVEIGPQIILLGPFEHPNIMCISGSTPKRPNMLKLWRLFLGPVFVSDQLSIRTKDNAELSIHLRYKVRFIIEKNDYEKAFSVEDFIGFATETMAGMIREEASQHNFEEFHSKASELIKFRIFGQNSVYLFQENGLEIFGIDIKKIIPEDPEIAAQLNAAIKSNMDVYVRKIQQTAELEAERQLVQGKIEIERSKNALILLEQENLRAKDVGNANIDATANIERAKGESAAYNIKISTQNELEEKRIANMLKILQQPGSESYIRLQQVNSFVNVEKTIILPSDSRLTVPMGNFHSLFDK